MLVICCQSDAYLFWLIDSELNKQVSLLSSISCPVFLKLINSVAQWPLNWSIFPSEYGFLYPITIFQIYIIYFGTR